MFCKNIYVVHEFNLSELKFIVRRSNSLESVNQFMTLTEYLITFINMQLKKKEAV